MSYNYITQYNSPNYTPGANTRAAYGIDRVIEGITTHHWNDPALNPTFEGTVNYLCRANGTSSAHYVATGTGRRVACIVSPFDTAWHSGNAWGNARTIGIELDPRCRDEDYDVAAELVADIRSAFGDVPIYWHSYFSSTACPGNWDPERLDVLSYTKYSHETEWGQGGNKAEPTPAPVPEPVPAPTWTYKVLDASGKQLGVFNVRVNAWLMFDSTGRTGKIVNANLQEVTGEFLAEFAPPSPPQPNRDDEQDKRLSAIEALVQSIASFLSGIFSGFKK